VLHILSSSAFAGLERHALRLVAELRELGCLAELACPSSAEMLRREAIRREVPLRVGLGAAVKTSPSIIHVHDGRSAIFGLILSQVRRSYFLRTQHFVQTASATRREPRRTMSLVFQRLLNHQVDGFIGVSSAVVHAARSRHEIGAAPVVVIPAGVVIPDDRVVAEARMTRVRAPCPVVLSAGRLEPERRFDVLLDAIPAVLNAAPNCRFLIAGSGSHEVKLRRQAAALGIEDALIWAGWMPELDRAFAQSHVYVNTWPFEGFGMATAEAMGWAIAVVATRSGASPELVQHGENGYLVPPTDPSALAGAITQLVIDPRRAASMGDDGRRRAIQRYSAQATASSMLRFYEDVMRQRVNHG
jgi:glycosyltransferase involved in cell wall biosynthesis